MVRQCRQQEIRSILSMTFFIINVVFISANSAHAQSADLQQANEHYNAGFESYRAGRLDTAVKHWEKACAIYDKIPGADLQRAGCEQNVGTVLSQMFRYEEAIVWFEKALRMYEKIPDTDRDQADCEKNFGTVLGRMSRHDEAIIRLKRALAVYEKTPGTEGDRDRADCHANIGILFCDMSRHKEAIDHLEKAIGMCKKIPDTNLLRATCEGKIGEALRGMSRHEEAVAQLERALTLFEKLPSTEHQRAGCRMNIGTALEAMHRYEKAIAQYEKALAMFRRIKGSEREQARCSMNIGVVLVRMSRYEEALSHYRAAMAAYGDMESSEADRKVCSEAIRRLTELVGQRERAASTAAWGWSGNLQLATAEFGAGLASYQQGHPDSALKHWENALAMYEALANTERQQADCHLNIGVVIDRHTPHHEDAVKRYKKALGIYARLPGTERDQANCEKNIGEAFRDVSRYEESIIHYRKALTIYARIPGAEPDWADCEKNIGLGLWEMLRYEEAQDRLESALAIYERILNTESNQASCKLNIGGILIDVSRYNEGIGRLKEALAMFEKALGTESSQAKCLANIGVALCHISRYEEAISYQEKALAILAKIPGTECEQAQCHVNIGVALRDTSRYKQAVAQYEKALIIYEKIPGAERGRADCLVNIGTALWDMSRYQESLDSCTKALALYSNISNSDRERAGCEMNVGLALEGLSRYREATAQYEKALAIYEKIPGTERERAACGANVGNVLAQMAHYEEAIEWYMKSARGYEEIPGTERDRAACEANIGAAFEGMLCYEEALLRYEKALRVYEKIPGAERQQLHCCRLVGNALVGLRRYEASTHMYKTAFEGYERIAGTERDRATCQANSGESLRCMYRYQEAIALWEKARESYEKIKGAELDAANCVGHVARALLAEGAFVQASVKYREARRIGWSVWLCTGLARSLEASGAADELEEAVRELLAVVSLTEQRREKNYGAEARMAASSEALPAYLYLARFLINRSRSDWELKEGELIKWATAREPRPRCLEAAFHYGDAGKARTLIELIQQRETDFGQDPAGKKLLDEDRRLLSQVSKTHKRKLSLPSDTEASRKELDDQISVWQQRRRQIEFELKKTYVGKFTVPEYEKASEIQASMPAGIAVLQYVVTEDDSRLIVLTKNSITAYDIPVKAEAPWDIPSKYRGRWEEPALMALASRFATDGSKIGLEGLVRLYRAPMDMAQETADAGKTLPETMVRVGMELGQLLLPDEARKLLTNKKIDHLVVIPDGQLHALPFAALPTGAVGAVEPRQLGECRFLAEDYRISYLPSWAMLGAIRSAAKERKVEGKQKEFLALADPVFSQDDPRISRGSNKIQADPIELAAVLRGFYAKYGWKRLPETAEEARRVGEVFGKVSISANGEGVSRGDAESFVFTGPAATKNVLEVARYYRHILFATHGVADPLNAWLSCVVLSPAPEQGYESPSYLKAADIIGLKLNADLVTLSACETGLGRLQSGEGMIGLSSAFFVAGARSLALTLWKVPSGETVEICVRFHELVKNGPNKAEALRQAQLDFLAKHPDKRHPFYWAAFILTGDWE